MAMGRLRRPIIPKYLLAFRTHSRRQSFCNGRFYIFTVLARPSSWLAITSKVHT